MGGLATALALKRLPSPHAHSITLLERNPQPVLHNQGAGIIAGGDTLALFDKYDRCERELAVSSKRRQYLDKDGKIVHKEDMEQNMTSWDLAYHMLRANVDGLDSAYCKVPDADDSRIAVKHLHGHRVTGLWEMKEKGGKLVVEYDGDLHRDRVQWQADIRRRRRLETAGYRVVVITADDLGVGAGALLRLVGARLRPAAG